MGGGGEINEGKVKEKEEDVNRLKADMRRSFIFLVPGYEKAVDLIEEGLSLNLQQQKQSLDYFAS